MESRVEDILRATIDRTQYDIPPESRLENLLIELKDIISQSGIRKSIIHTTNPTTQQLATCTALDLIIKESKYNNVRTIHLVRGVQASRIDIVNNVDNYYWQTWALTNDGTITKESNGHMGECYGLDDVDLWTPIDYILYYD